MSHAASFRWCFVALCLVGAATLHASNAHSGDDPVIIRVYDSAQTGEATRAAAIRTASDILADTDLPAAWHDCTGDAERRHCDHLRDQGTPLRRSGRQGPSLIIRITPTFVPGVTTSRGSIKTRARDSSAGLILGFAVVEPSTGDGVMATIFLDRVQAVAQRAGVPPAALLGRAIAHEVGHLLLATNAHSSTGLMREVWTDAELTLDRPEDWLFAAPDRSALMEMQRRRQTEVSPARHMSSR